MARRKRRKAAPAGRVLATGLSASAMLGIVAVMAAQPAPSWELPANAAGGGSSDGALTVGTPPTVTATSTTVPATTIVTRVEQRVIRVYEDGAPVGNGAAAPANVGAPPAPATAVAPVTGTPPPQPAPQPTSSPVPPPTVASPPPPAAPTTVAAPVPKCKASKC